MALKRRRAMMALAGIMAINGFTGCTGDASLVRKDAPVRAETLVRADDPADSSVKPNIVRSQAPEVLPPVRIGRPQTDSTGRSFVSDATGKTDASGRAFVSDPLNMGAPSAVPPLSAPVQQVGSDVPVPPVNVGALVQPVPDVKPASGKMSATSKMTDEGDTQVRIVASIGNNPIYESEVREAVYQRLGELLKLAEREQAVKQKEMFREELRRIIERELVLEDMTSTLTSRKQTNALGKLKEAAGKEADALLKQFKKERGVSADEDFKTILRSQGLTMFGIRRQIERGTMMRIYMQEKVSPKIEGGIGLGDIRDYYEAHGGDFKSEDSVKWLDLFVMTEKFASPADAKQYAMQLLAQIQKGADFGPLATKSGHGDSALRNGLGIGEKPGEIFPPELEPTVLRTKPGQATIQETENGFHIIKVTDRTVAGRRPLDEKLQAEIRRKVQAVIFEREAKRYVDTLWKRSQPQVWIDL
ncbi:peptidyl-prolyl cis-trans isomerase [Zavarzinella formosa]|uniref:peptidyl-prolyl cis-trans isomerase n=1 Tax=Zavarzinella formosa TaxID=360055 RepID=UPI00030193BB|nr:peptidyl-prolyl cis-trans isomerase [Zavarzinella formosa]